MTKSLIGKVYLVGAGPGISSITLLRAADIFTEDVIFYELINRELLDYRARNAECFYVSKRSVGVLRESTTHIFIARPVNLGRDLH